MEIPMCRSRATNTVNFHPSDSTPALSHAGKLVQQGGKTADFRQWDELVLDAPHGPRSVVWAKIKLPQRAVEKTVRSYGQDPSFLVDLCRQTIVFLTPTDLLACLKTIIADQVCSPHPRTPPAAGPCPACFTKTCLALIPSHSDIERLGLHACQSVRKAASPDVATPIIMTPSSSRATLVCHTETPKSSAPPHS
jgi:hypothetical protein